jgi:hypothetical protein
MIALMKDSLITWSRVKRRRAPRGPCAKLTAGRFHVEITLLGGRDVKMFAYGEL